MSWKPEVHVVGEPKGKWSRNGLVFATKEEAEQSARDLFFRWTGCDAFQAAEVDEPVNYTYHNHLLKEVTHADE